MARPSHPHPRSCQQNRGCEGTHPRREPPHSCTHEVKLPACAGVPTQSDPDTAHTTTVHNTLTQQCLTLNHTHGQRLSRSLGRPLASHPPQSHVRTRLLTAARHATHIQYTTIQHRKGTWHLLHRHNKRGTSTDSLPSLPEHSRPKKQLQVLAGLTSCRTAQLLLAHTTREPAANRASTQAGSHAAASSRCEPPKAERHKAHY